MRSPRAEVPARGRTIVGASAIGQAHVRGGLPSQDAFRFGEARKRFVIAVADGLGSAKRSDIGAAVATNAAASRVAQRRSGDPARIALEALTWARTALTKVAAARNEPLEHLACTLLVVVGDDRRVGIAHIGDGAVVGCLASETYVLSPPGSSEYLNEVDPLTADDWTTNVRNVSCIAPIDALAVFTDGCQHAALRRNGTRLQAHSGFFDPLFAYARNGETLEEKNKAIGRLLGGLKLGEHSDDDKTLVLAVLR